jgi:hypothetical protein
MTVLVEEACQERRDDINIFGDGVPAGIDAP